MKVTLIRPPAYSAGFMGVQRVPYLGIAYVAAAARQAGYAVDIIDMCGEALDRTEIVHGKYVAYGMAFAALQDRLHASDVIGFTCMFSQDWVFNRELIQYVHTLSPASILVAGGEHVSAIPDYCLNDCAELDVCVIGEGEEVFVNLLNVLVKDADWATVAGLAYRASGAANITHTPKAPRIQDLDRLPLPAWDLTPLEHYLARSLNYHLQRGRTIPMLASRGCPYQCTFCSNFTMWRTPWVERSPQRIADEIETYLARYQATNFVFSDLTAVVRKDHIVAFCYEILRRGLRITWQLPTLRTESLDRATCALMYQAGCRELDFAVESGSTRVLASVHKKNDPAKIAGLIKDSLAVGMNLSINMIVGLPEEGYRDFLKSYMFVMRLAWRGLHEVNAFPFIPYPGSQLFHEFWETGKLRLEDRYFLALFGYADLFSAVSWSNRFSPRMLSFLRLFMMASFYSLMLLSHPQRLFRLLKNAWRGESSTKLEGVLKRAITNIRHYRK